MKQVLILRTGCSGYNNKQWKPAFYPKKMPQRKWLQHYFEHFSTIELHTTFYRFPTAETLSDWYSNSPEGFIVSVRAHKFITHSKRFKGCKKEVDEFYLACEHGLKEKLGCILFQLPPTIKYNEDKLQQIINTLDPRFRNVVEFRDPSWWTKKVYDALGANNISFCSVSHPAMPEPLIANTSTIYLRLHGVPDMFHSAYDTEFLSQLHELLRKKRSVKEVFIYFNNIAGSEGVLNALEFQRLINEHASVTV